MVYSPLNPNNAGNTAAGIAILDSLAKIIQIGMMFL